MASPTTSVVAKYPGLKALRELEVRVRPTGLRVPAESMRQVSQPAHAANLFKGFSDRRPAESLMAIHVDAHNRPVGVHEVARGAMNCVHVSPRELYAPALVTGARAVIIAHNHPSGDATPSDDDEALTKRLRAAGDLIGVQMLDHLVIGTEDFYSFQSQRTFRNVWSQEKDYSSGGWGTTLMAAAGVVGVIGMIWLGIRGSRARPGETVAGLEVLAAA